MPFESKSLDDYIDVAQRIADFRAQYPEDLRGTGIGGKGDQAAIRAAKIAWLVHRFGPDIHSSKDLSYNQAAKALQELT